MYKIGITGGIGSGKTTICRLFSLLRVPIYNSDERAKAIMVDDEKVVEDIKYLMGNEAYNSDGSLNTTYISARVFSDALIRNGLNNIVHPVVKIDAEKWFGDHKSNHYVIKESALLFETGIYKQLDKNILVTAPIDVRIQRIQLRDQLATEEIQRRMDTQMADKEKELLADYIIENNGSTSLIDQVVAVHQKILNL